MPSPTGHAATENASRYLQQLAKHWSHRFAVELDPESAKIDFGDGQEVTLRATTAELRACVAASTQKDLGEFETVVTGHLRRFAFRQDPVFEWTRGRW